MPLVLEFYSLQKNQLNKIFQNQNQNFSDQNKNNLWLFWKKIIVLLMANYNIPSHQNISLDKYSPTMF
jgi:hypothetical protein